MAAERHAAEPEPLSHHSGCSAPKELESLRQATIRRTRASPRYLARYTHRVAIGNSRLVSLENDHVTFRYKKCSSEPEWKTKRLPAVEFLRRFTLHVLPPGFVRIRYFGFLANRNRRKAVATCRNQLGGQLVDEAIRKVESERLPVGPKCPTCEQATLVEIRGLPREPPHSRGPPP